MRHLVEHHVFEERIEGHVLHLIVHDQLVRDRRHDPIELEAHRVLELQPSGALLELDFLVVRQIDGDRLRTGVRLTRGVHEVIGIEIGR